MNERDSQMNYIQMNTEMTKAIFDGRKVQTRRVIKSVKDIGKEFTNFTVKNGVFYAEFTDELRVSRIKQPIDDFIKQESKYQIGETIWVREPAKITSLPSESEMDNYRVRFEYLADNFTSTIEIPARIYDREPEWLTHCKGIPNGCIKEMARIFLKITDMRVERLQDITIENCYCEGVDPFDVMEMLDGTEFKEFIVFENLWNKTAPKGYKWEDNPYVFVYEFERVEEC